jgi:hypothetical protein
MIGEWPWASPLGVVFVICLYYKNVISVFVTVIEVVHEARAKRRSVSMLVVNVSLDTDLGGDSSGL